MTTLITATKETNSYHLLTKTQTTKLTHDCVTTTGLAAQRPTPSTEAYHCNGLGIYLNVRHVIN